MPLQVKNKDFVVAEHQELMQNSSQAFVRTLFPAEAQEANGVDKVSLPSPPGAWRLPVCFSAAATHHLALGAPGQQIWHTWARKMTVVASYSAVPLMLTVVPRGITKSTMLPLHPISFAHSMATCMETKVAECLICEGYIEGHHVRCKAGICKHSCWTESTESLIVAQL